MSNPLGPLYSIEFVACVLCAVAWYKAADVENVSPWLWVGLSVGVYALTWLWLGWGLLGILLAQVGLLVAVGVARAWLSHRRGGG
jgi:hypothetical protein